MKKCCQCDRELTVKDLGLHRKFVDRRAQEFLCAACLAKKFGVTEQQMLDLADRLIETGCGLFQM